MSGDTARPNLFMNEGKSSGKSVNCDRLTYSKVVYIWKFWLESQRSAIYNTLVHLEENAKPGRSGPYDLEGSAHPGR